MSDQLKILIIGGSGGIGLSMIRQIFRRTPDASVVATWHSRQPEVKIDGLRWHQLDASDESQYQHLSDQYDAFDWIINTAGFLHTPDKGPEKTVKHFESEFFLRSMAVNTLPMLLIAKHLGPKLKRSQGGVFASISAKVGSISDNQLGGWLSYRSSKAALNMAIKTLSIEWRRQMKNVCVVALHPGTTDTRLSKPFQSSVPAKNLFSPEQTAGYLIKIIAGLTPEDSGKFISWDGKTIPW